MSAAADRCHPNTACRLPTNNADTSRSECRGESAASSLVWAYLTPSWHLAVDVSPACPHLGRARDVGFAVAKFEFREAPSPLLLAGRVLTGWLLLGGVPLRHRVRPRGHRGWLSCEGRSLEDRPLCDCFDVVIDLLAWNHGQSVARRVAVNPQQRLMFPVSLVRLRSVIALGIHRVEAPFGGPLLVLGPGRRRL